MNVTVRRSVAVAAVALFAPGLAACGVNFGEQTDQVYNPAVGTDNQTADVDVLNALIVSGTKGSGTVVAALVNNNQTRADKLLTVKGLGVDASATIKVTGPTVIKPNGLLNLADSAGISIRSNRVVPGYFVKLRFTFARAGNVIVDVPVVVNRGPYADVKVP